jgi:signal transduction histidine kinase
MLTFPGVFAPRAGGLIGAGLQSTTFLYIQWHVGFPTFLIAYALLKNVDPVRRLQDRSAATAILSSVAITAAMVCAGIFLVITDHTLLPRFMLDAIHPSALWYYATGSLALLNTLALILLWSRYRSVLDLWLMVVICAYVTDLALNTYPDPSRYSLGWYVARVCQLLSGSLVLFVLLYEITTLYARLLLALESDFAHKNRLTIMGELTASLTHEITQPIASARINARAGLNFLERRPPDLGEVGEALGCVLRDADRAGDIIDRIRDHIKKAPPRKHRFDLNEAINEVLVLARSAITRNGVSVQTFTEGLLPVQGDRVQLQQVVLNLILNAVEAMGSSDAGRQELLISTEQSQANGVLVAVRDCGPGIDPEHLERVFDAFYTTKSSGVGMGLSICRSIINAHGGRLWAEPNEPRGAVFQFTLPIAEN